MLLRAFPILGVLVLTSALAQDARPAKKLIELGWDQPDSQWLRDTLVPMEQRPFNGVMVRLVGRRDDGKPIRLKPGFSADPWRWEWFADALADLQACRFERFTDNFVMFGANPGNVDWFDDAGWANIVDHWRIAARLAKQAGLRGMEFDPEPYTKPFAQFRYAAQPERQAHSFDAYWDKARERGREVLTAVAEEYPDIVIFTLFMNSVNRMAIRQSRPREALRSAGYGLYPAFIDGWLDAAPPTVTFVDGCESAYLFNSTAQYLEAAVLIKGGCQALVSPENRAKYRAQVQVGFGVYLDAYWNPRDSEWGRWYVDGLGGERVERLRANVQTALRVADEYVWIYGEKFRWGPTTNPRVRGQTWPEGLPGCEDALRMARDPSEFARVKLAELAAAGRLVNLARNGDFAAATAPTNSGAPEDWQEGGAPAGWHAWQHSESKGAFTWDRELGAARAAGVGNGCFIQSYDVEPGQVYAARVRRRVQGAGETWVRFRWQTVDGQWTAEPQDRLYYWPLDTPDWTELSGVAEVPEGAGKLVLLLGIGGQESDRDVAWFDDVEVARVR